MSDQEWDAANPVWQEQVRSRTINMTPYTDIQNPDLPSYDYKRAEQFVNPIFDTMAQSKWEEFGLDATSPEFGAYKDTLRGQGQFADPMTGGLGMYGALSNWNTGYGFSTPEDGASHTVRYDEKANVFNQANADKREARMENQVARQQAYDGMLGSGQLNGIMKEGYTNPMFGQVTGSTENPFDMRGAPGVDASWTAGVYDPTNQSGTYNPQAVKKNFWGL
jgi:hypothetical protein